MYGADKAKINAGKQDISRKQNDYANSSIQLRANYESLLNELAAYQIGIDNYLTFGKKLAEETLLSGSISFNAGEIDYLQYATLLDHAAAINIQYLQNTFFYNLTVIESNFILQ